MYLRMKPCGAACAWESWLTMLLLVLLPCRQPLAKFLIADDLYNSVHLVMAEPAKLLTGNLELPGLIRRKVHVNRQPRHGILFDAHYWHGEAVNHVVRSLDELSLA